jgi:hypothetical protein
MAETYSTITVKVPVEPKKVDYIHSDNFAFRLGWTEENIKVIKVYTNPQAYSIFNPDAS